MILMIDNYDSFTYNIVQYCLELGADLKVIRNDELSVDDIKKLNPEKIILSPGPATPNEAGVCLDVIESIGKYGNATASLSAIKTDQLPSFLVYGTISGW